MFPKPEEFSEIKAKILSGAALDPDATEDFNTLINTCLSLDFSNNFNDLSNSAEKLLEECSQAQMAVNRFFVKIQFTPLLAAVVNWAKHVGKDSVIGAKYIHLMNEFLNTNIIFANLFEGEIRNMTIQDLVDCEPAYKKIPGKIRCLDQWNIEKQEECVRLFCEFSKWLSKITFGKVGEVVDCDRQMSVRRVISYDNYIRILREMDLRERIIAKFFYLCNVQDLEKVLNIKVEDISQINKHSDYLVKINEGYLTLPDHLLHDINLFIGGRTSGYLFPGKTGGRINATTPYRALRTVAEKLKFKKSFTFNSFLENR